MPHFEWRGHRLYYREQGEGDLLLILHGNTASSFCHQGELAHFGARYRAVAMDVLGVGQSDRVPVWDDDWWAQGAAQASALLSHLGHLHCIAVGTSGGGVIALLMAIRFPGSVRSVVADSCVERLTPRMLRQGVIHDRARRTPYQVAFWAQAHGVDWEQVVRADTHLLRRFVESGGDWYEGRLRAIQCPVLLTASLRDTLLPGIGVQVGHMADQIPDCRAYLHHEGDHPLMWSQAQVFRAACDRFLAELDAS
jgi:pimeloyl-ACP methyl ester carboxylesterase